VASPREIKSLITQALTLFNERKVANTSDVVFQGLAMMLDAVVPLLTSPFSLTVHFLHLSLDCLVVLST
jgi:hypothetical protein